MARMRAIEAAVEILKKEGISADESPNDFYQNH